MDNSFDNEFSVWRFEKHKIFAERYIAANNRKILDDAEKEFNNIKMLVEGAKTK